MTRAQMARLAMMLAEDHAGWKDPWRAVQECLAFYNGPGGSSDPDAIGRHLVRQGRPLTKEEKKLYGINATAKVGAGAFDHFTNESLRVAVSKAILLGQAVSTIEAALSHQHTWKKWGIMKVEFSPAPDACPVCMAMKKTYPIDEVPIPVLDTHLECRCALGPEGGAR